MTSIFAFLAGLAVATVIFVVLNWKRPEDLDTIEQRIRDKRAELDGLEAAVAGAAARLRDTVMKRNS